MTIRRALLPPELAVALKSERERAALEQQISQKLAARLIEGYAPYPKQAAFHAAGAAHRERALIAGNQLGKTFSAGAETAFHLTGEYPEWWQGRRFDRPTAGWACGVTSEVTRDTVQRTLLGRFENLGTGAIPRRAIKATTASRGVASSVDTAFVHHRSGGVSQVQFKSYESGREKFQGESLDFVWLDEEPPAEIYSECVTRTNATGGCVYATFTPLKGMTAVVMLFYPRPSSIDRWMVQMEIEDALHIDAAQRTRVIAAYRPHEREARTRGVPMLGSGAVVTVPESAWICEAFTVPPHWPGMIGLDIGADHPAAASLIRFDTETDCAYVTNSIASPDLTIGQHANVVKSLGRYPVAWPHDANQRDRSSGAPIAAIYRNHGLDCLLEHAQHESGGYGVEASVADVVTRMEEGRLKIFSHLSTLRQELRMWHRDDGRIVTLNDDEISAMRYGLMMRRFARRARSMDGGTPVLSRRIGLP